jgi:hypothetical protein
MAEIKIERKKQIWPWLLVGVILGALLIYFLTYRDYSKSPDSATEAGYITNTNEPDLIGVNENNSTVAAYVNFVENSNERMSLDHAFTNEALLKLVDATNAMANEVGYEVRADMEKVKELCQHDND